MRKLWRAFGLVIGTILGTQLFLLGMQVLMVSRVSEAYVGLVQGKTQSDDFSVQLLVEHPFVRILVGVATVISLAVALTQLTLAFVIDDGSPLLTLWATQTGMIALVMLLLIYVGFGNVNSDDFVTTSLTALLLTTSSMVIGVAINPGTLRTPA